MKFLKDFFNKSWAPYTIATCSAVLLYFAINNIIDVFVVLYAVYQFVLPVFIGLIIAYVMNPFVEFVNKKLYWKVKSEKIARRLSVLTALVSVIALVVLLMVALIPQVLESITTFAENFQGYANSLQVWMKSILNNSTKGEYIFSFVNKSITELSDNISKMLSDNMGNIIGTSVDIGKGFFTFVIACIIAIYFLVDAPNLVDKFNKLLMLLLKKKTYKNFTSFLQRCNHILLRYIVCDLVEGLIVGVVNFIFMTLLGMDYAVLISVVVAVTNLAPTFGPIIGGGIGAFILVLVHPMHALIFIIFTIVLQTIDGYIVKPKLFGDTLGVSAIWILIVLVVGGRMFGVAGILLAIPFAAICDYIFKEIVWDWLQEWKKKREA